MVGMMGSSGGGGLDISDVLAYAREPEKLERLAESVAEQRSLRDEAITEAAKALQEARDEAANILASARENADVMLEEATEEADRRNQDIVSRETSLAGRESDVASLQQTARKEMTRIEEEDARLRRLIGDIERREAEADGRVFAAQAKVGDLREFIEKLAL